MTQPALAVQGFQLISGSSALSACGHSPKTDRRNIDTKTSACRNIGTSYCYLRFTPLQSLTPQLNTHQTDIRKGRIPESVLYQNTASPSLHFRSPFPMGTLRLLRAMRNAAPGLGPRSPDRSCDSLLKCGELPHSRNSSAPLPVAPVPSGPDGRRCLAAASHRS